MHFFENFVGNVETFPLKQYVSTNIFDEEDDNILFASRNVWFNNLLRTSGLTIF